MPSLPFVPHISISIAETANYAKLPNYLQVTFASLNIQKRNVCVRKTLLTRGQHRCRPKWHPASIKYRTSSKLKKKSGSGRRMQISKATTKLLNSPARGFGLWNYINYWQVCLVANNKFFIWILRAFTFFFRKKNSYYQKLFLRNLSVYDNIHVLKKTSEEDTYFTKITSQSFYVDAYERSSSFNSKTVRIYVKL